MTPIEPAVRFSIRTHCQPGWREPGRLLYDCELIHVIEGEYSIRLLDSVQKLRKGDLFITGPTTDHESWTDHDQSVIRDCLHFDWNRSHSSVRSPLFCAYGERYESHMLHSVPTEFSEYLNICMPATDASPIIPVVETMFAYLSEGHTIGEDLLYAVLRFLVGTGSPSARHHTRSEPAVRIIKNYIDEHYAEQIDLELLSRLVGMTASHACMAFRRAIGRPPIQYLNDTRLAHAHRLLRESDFNVAEVANSVGFGDANYFSRFFKMKTGVAPRDVR